MEPSRSQATSTARGSKPSTRATAAQAFLGVSCAMAVTLAWACRTLGCKASTRVAECLLRTASMDPLPKNDGWTALAYDFGEDQAENQRLSAILNDACHVFHCHAGGTWQDHDKDRFAGRLAAELEHRPTLVGRLLATEDRVVKMVTYRALELLKARSVD
jgi:hypothetical protein